MIVDENSVSCFVDANGVTCFVDANGLTLCCGAAPNRRYKYVTFNA